MLKVSLALVATALTFASAKAFDNFGSRNAAAGFAQYGLQGLAIAGQGHIFDQVPQFGSSEEAPVAPMSYFYIYSPRCWTRHLTVANGNTLVNAATTICR